MTFCFLILGHFTHVDLLLLSLNGIKTEDAVNVNLVEQRILILFSGVKQYYLIHRF